MFLNKLPPRTQCSFTEMPSWKVGWGGVKYWAGSAAKEGLVLEWVKSHLWKGSNLRVEWLYYWVWANLQSAEENLVLNTAV